MHKPIGGGLLLGLAPFGLLAHSTEIDKVAHESLAVTRSVARPSWPCLVWKRSRHDDDADRGNRQ
jgi:hypothetical protein